MFRAPTSSPDKDRDTEMTEKEGEEVVKIQRPSSHEETILEVATEDGGIKPGWVDYSTPSPALVAQQRMQLCGAEQKDGIGRARYVEHQIIAEEVTISAEPKKLGSLPKDISHIGTHEFAH